MLASMTRAGRVAAPERSLPMDGILHFAAAVIHLTAAIVDAWVRMR